VQFKSYTYSAGKASHPHRESSSRQDYGCGWEIRVLPGQIATGTGSGNVSSFPQGIYIVLASINAQTFDGN